jgi:Inositol polyphosphate kinase
MSGDEGRDSIDAFRCSQYPHQVGGHGQIVQADESTVLKPFVPKEAAFYEMVYADDAPEDIIWLRSFTPRYLGKRSVFRNALSPNQSARPPGSLLLPSGNNQGHVVGSRFPEASECLPRVGASEAVTVPAVGTIPDESVTRSAPTSNVGHLDAESRNAGTDGAPVYEHLRWAYTTGGKNESAANAVSVIGRGIAQRTVERARGSERMQSICREGQGAVGSLCTIQVSPWAVHMADRRPAATTDVSKVIVLEDVNRDFRFPCVADVKCGKRHYDDDATPAKQARHIAKALSTTTAATGIRFIGLQSLKGSVYEFRDKYHGRRLKESDLVPEAHWFFHNGGSLRTDSIRLTIEKLRQIATHMQSQSYFLFYSSSLLLVYEGDVERPAKVDIRMIDFAHTQRSQGERDDGYISGIIYLIGVLESVLRIGDGGAASIDAMSSCVTPPLTPLNGLGTSMTVDDGKSKSAAAAVIEEGNRS